LSRDAPACVQLPSACGCYQLAPQRTRTSYPGPMPGTPRLALRAPAPRAATALTPPNQSAQWLPAAPLAALTWPRVGALDHVLFLFFAAILEVHLWSIT
jgi:hypothetical protein